MRPSWKRWDDAAEVREAAEAWGKAGLLDVDAARRMGELFPRQGPGVGWLWRVLLFLFVFLAAWALFATTILMLRPENRYLFGILMTCYGVAMVLITELLLERNRFAATGAESATSLVAVSCLTGGVLAAVLPESGHSEFLPRITLAWLAVVLAAAARRWGTWLYAGGAAAAALFCLGTFSGGRVFVIVAGAAMAAVAGGWRGRDSLPRPHRWCLDAVVAVGLAGTYVAVNRYSLDHAWVEQLIPHGWKVKPDAGAGAATRLLSAAGTAFLPFVVLLWGIRSRRRVAIDAAIVMAVASAVTLRAYVHVAPLWVLLSGCGTALVGLAFWLIRFLDGGAGRERAGFTAAPLFDDRRREQLLPVVAALAATPGARTIPEKPGFEGGGGTFGGGGAQAGF